MPAESVDLILVADMEIDMPKDARCRVARYFGEPMGRLNLPFEAETPNSPLLGIVALGTYLKRNGFSVKVFDNVFTIPAARERFLDALDQQPVAVGISTSFLFRKESVQRLTDWVRARAPKARVVLGGASAEKWPELQALGDVTVLGNGEKTLTQIMRALKSGGALNDIPNLIFRQNGDWIRTPLQANIDVDEIPAPDWDLIDIRPSRCYSIEASKGCRYNCSFCGFADKRNQRMKHIPLVVEEMKRNFERYGVTLCRFVDANLTSWPEQTEALCDAIIEANMPVEWGCYARVDNFARHPALAKKMRQAGCIWVFFGIESASDSILKRMRKGYTSSDIWKGVQSAKQAGLRVHGNFIIGFPGETRSTVEDTLEVVYKLELDTVQFFVLDLNDGSDASIALSREEFGLQGSRMTWRHATMDSEEASALADYCHDAVCMKMENTLIGSEKLVIYYLMGGGLTADEAWDYLRAFRDYSRAESRADVKLQEAALKCIRDYRIRLHQFYSQRMGVPPFAVLGSR